MLGSGRFHVRLAADRIESSAWYDEIVSARLDHQLAALGAQFQLYRAALAASEPVGPALESLIGDGLALALAELKADSSKGLALAESLLAVLRVARATCVRAR